MKMHQSLAFVEGNNVSTLDIIGELLNDELANIISTAQIVNDNAGYTQNHNSGVWARNQLTLTPGESLQLHFLSNRI